MAIAIRNWQSFLASVGSIDGLTLWEPPGRLDFFVYQDPSAALTEDSLRASYHIHVFLESDIGSLQEGDVVAFRINTILPKTTFGDHQRPNLVDVDPAQWAVTVGAMDPTNAATVNAARLFASVMPFVTCGHPAGCAHHGVNAANYATLT